MFVARLCKKTMANAITHLRSAAAARPGRFASSTTTVVKRLKAEQIGRKFRLSDEQLQDVACRMAVATNAGLRSRLPDSRVATVKCWDTRVDFPMPPPPSSPATRPVVDRYLSLEMTRGEYFRTRLTDVSAADPDRVNRVTDTHPVPQCLKTGSVQSLFDHLSDRLAAFIGRHNVYPNVGLPLAFTLGFPIRQTALDEGVLYRWTKEFDCSTTDVAGRNVVDELRSSLRRSGVSVGPVALFNDACAPLLNNMQLVSATCTSDNRSTVPRVSVVVDDGCNCCYAERVENVRNRRRRTEPVSGTDHTIVNTEWGGFGDDGMLDKILTNCDKRLDERSMCPGKQIFEKMTSGLYMTELVREMVLEMIRDKVLFGGRVKCSSLTTRPFKLEHVCAVELDPQSYETARAVLSQVLNVTDPSDFDCEMFRYACECVTKRSAHLVSAGLTSVLRRLDPVPEQDAMVRVAVGGSVFKKHPKYQAMVRYKTSQLVGMPISLQTGDYRQGALFVAEMLARMSSSTEPCGT